MNGRFPTDRDMAVIDFHAEANRFTYAARDAAGDWSDIMCDLVDPAGKHVLDIGCGGGIYSAEWARLGAKIVIGIDFSDQMLIAAREKSADLANVSFLKGSALETGLPEASADIVFERALIHHVSDRLACFAEAYRLLVPGGLYIVQDRTPEDVRLPASPEHIRGFFFQRFPRLLEIEIGRRPTAESVAIALIGAGFEMPDIRRIRETRRTYTGFGELAADLARRTGRSILHALDDQEIAALIEHVGARVPAGALIEREPWTIWAARKPA
jgi:ubiquinone/menaquinone biosynthesis C-methylase UbiE